MKQLDCDGSDNPPGPDCDCKYDPAVDNEILSIVRQNATKLDQILEYVKVAPTADQLRQEHQRIEQLIHSSVARLEDQHKRIEQEIRDYVSRVDGNVPADYKDELAGIATKLLKIEGALSNIEGGGDTTGIGSRLSAISSTLNELELKMSGLAEPGPGEIKLTVDTPTFLSPDYVDMSLIWAQQKSSGIHHAVLVVNTSDPSWTKLKPIYEAARSKFAPLSVFDVHSQNVTVTQLPQLVLYPKEGDPRVVNDPGVVVEELSKLARLP